MDDADSARQWLSAALINSTRVKADPNNTSNFSVPWIKEVSVQRQLLVVHIILQTMSSPPFRIGQPLGGKLGKYTIAKQLGDTVWLAK
jgi:hypothetical protein